MDLTNNLAASCMSSVMLIIIFWYTKRYNETGSAKNKTFSLLVLATIMMLFLDILGSMDGNANTLLPLLNHTGNFLIFLFSPIVPSVWLLYVRQFTNPSKTADRWLFIIIIALNAANWISVLLSLKFGWYYHIDEHNIYHRGPYHSISFVFALLLIVAATLQVVLNRAKIERKYYTALLLFTILPSASVIVQIFVSGFTFTYNSVALSVLILFLFVQVQDSFTDYLTGVANRKKLELHLRKKALDSSPGQTFSAIMLDIDNFKAINDTLGHRAGDHMLSSTAHLLKECVGDSGLIARYGGDEFCIVLDTSDPGQLRATASKIRESLKVLNTTSNLPIQLSLSMGYAIYKHGMTVDDFQNTIDKLMYEHKRCPL